METKSKLLNPRKLDLSQVGSAIGLILVVIVASIITQGNFLSASNLTNVFRQVTIMGFARPLRSWDSSTARPCSSRRSAARVAASTTVGMPMEKTGTPRVF